MCYIESIAAFGSLITFSPPKKEYKGLEMIIKKKKKKVKKSSSPTLATFLFLDIAVVFPLYLREKQAGRIFWH